MTIFKSIRGRLMASVFLLSAVAVGIGAFGWIIAGPIAERARITDEVDINLINFIRMQKNIILTTSDTQRDDFQSQQAHYSDLFDNALAEWDPIASAKGKQDIQDIRTAWNEYKEMNSEVI